MRRLTGPVLFALAVAACGGSGNGGPTDPGNGDEGFRGNYQGVHRFILNIGTIGDGIECPGSLRIISLNGNQFSGQVTIGDCPEVQLDAASGPVTGTVSADGAVVIPLDDEDIAALETFLSGLGCTVVETEDEFTGGIEGNVLSISFSADLDCEDVAGEVTFTWEIVATKS